MAERSRQKEKKKKSKTKVREIENLVFYMIAQYFKG